MAFNTSSSSNRTVVEEDKIQLVTPLLVCVVVIGFLSQILNGGVFILVIRQKTIRRNPYHFLVLMLSVSDYLIGLSNVCIGPGIIFPYLHKCGILVVIQIFLLTNGLYLSLLQIFLISLQRYLVICKEKWNPFFFSKKRKYIVCISSWALVTATNLSLLSPPEREFRFSEERFVAFVYGGLYPAFTFYNRFLTLTFLSTTIILYLITLRHVLKNFGKVKPLPERSIHSNTRRKSNTNTRNSFWKTWQLDISSFSKRGCFKNQSKYLSFLFCQKSTTKGEWDNVSGWIVNFGSVSLDRTPHRRHFDGPFVAVSSILILYMYD